jgi:hypothetical protein
MTGNQPHDTTDPDPIKPKQTDAADLTARAEQLWIGVQKGPG